MLENQSVSQRFAYLDALKCIAIILVVVAHMLGEGEFKFIYSPEIRKFIYTFHMPLFRLQLDLLQFLLIWCLHYPSIDCFSLKNLLGLELI